MIIKIQRKLRNELFPMHEHPSFRSGKTAASNKTRPIRLTILRGEGEERKKKKKSFVHAISRKMSGTVRKVETIGDRGVVTLFSLFIISSCCSLSRPLSPRNLCPCVFNNTKLINYWATISRLIPTATPLQVWSINPFNLWSRCHGETGR